MLRRAAVATPAALIKLPRRLAAVRWASSASEQAVVVAFPGEQASLSNIAAKQFFRGVNADYKGLGTFEQAFDAVSKGEATFGVIPIENSSSGTVSKTYDLLLEHDVSIAGDLGINEKYCFCVKPDVDLSAVRSVMSHPNILDACSEFMEQKLPPGQDLIATKTTSEAALDMAKSDRTDIGVIATREAASLHGLKVVGADIGNDVFMETRYVLIRRSDDKSTSWNMPSSPQLVQADIVKKASACFVVNNKPRALFKLLSCFALRDINVEKVESRPLGRRLPTHIGRLWDHILYVDYVVPQDHTEEDAKHLWAVLCEFSSWQRDFGTYSSLVSHAEKKPKTWDQMYQTMTWG